MNLGNISSLSINCILMTCITMLLIFNTLFSKYYCYPNICMKESSSYFFFSHTCIDATPLLYQNKTTHMTYCVVTKGK